MPPLSRLVKAQLVIVVVLGLVAALYGGVRYARMDEAVGVGVYRVSVQMEQAGGLFPEAQVTYRGVAAGRVRDMAMTADGVEVTLVLDSGGEQIPDSAVAVVANRSAIGEQYLDLQPTTHGGPYLHDGSVIHDVRYPPELDDVLSSTIALTKTIPTDALRTTITELGKAFDGKGEDLTRLVDALGDLSKTGVDSLDETISLITNANPVLETQAEQSDEILEWSKGLDAVAATLASSDPAVRRILSDGPRAASTLQHFLDSNGDDATKLIGQLGGTVHAVRPASFAAGQLFAMLSILSGQGGSTSPGDGEIHFGIVLETENPPSCTRGYESTTAMLDEIKRKNPDFDVNYDDFPFNTDAGCSVPTGNPTAVRGANNADLANPDFVQPWDDTPKKDPDKLNLNPIATQLARLMGVRTR
ncbi:MCE family protein [Gordonia humi]|uniref:Phospholipid/cholesterol/gamma-HCH transport system substrate-binding protein n=1 Tax=Gordonia humi TaxID=686429 RepID=A0A840F4J4_9ACTN|nr:MCE family protein [Gordonia humi]MBB4137564.1 phospholipid/cholesterol/gamma-HCH transport system substrate-binding protein [Gordonia humi]